MKKEMPEAEIYNQETKYFPWGILITEIIDLIAKKAPRDATILDLMCGTGLLAKSLLEKRPDLRITGVDINQSYIDFAKKNAKAAKFICADVLTWQTDQKFDLVLCMGSLHHIPFDRQPEILLIMKTCLKEDGSAIIGDPVIPDFENEKERKLGANKLGTEYLSAIIKKNAPDDIVKAAVDVLARDVMLDGEYKTSCKKFEEVIRKIFQKVEKHKTWPDIESDYGEYYFVLS